MTALKKTVWSGVAVLVLLALAAGSFFYFGNYSEGFRVGTLLKLSRKGVGFKTWEGELSQGFLEQNPELGVATRVWTFSVRGDDTDTLQKLESAMAHGDRVKLHYREKYVRLPWVGETRYLVHDVETVQKQGSPAPSQTQ